MRRWMFVVACLVGACGSADNERLLDGALGIADSTVSKVDGSVHADRGARRDRGIPDPVCVPTCGKDEVCLSGSCKPLGGCPCPLGAYCDLSTNSCKAGCISDEHCPSSSWCDTAARQCKPGCRNDEGCAVQAERCIDHVCKNTCPKCDDGSPCTTDSCIRGQCQYAPANEGGACADEGNPCTVDVCRKGKCAHEAGNEGAACKDDGNICTKDVCQAGQCAHLPTLEGQACPDTPCSSGSTCKGGTCHHPALADGSSCGPTTFDRCTAGSCVKVKGVCYDYNDPWTPSESYAQWKEPNKNDYKYGKPSGCSCDNQLKNIVVSRSLSSYPYYQNIDTKYCSKCSKSSSDFICW